LVRRQHHDLVALADHAGGDGAAEAAEVEVGPVDVLDREAQVDQVAIGGDVHRLEQVQQRLALIPGHVRAGLDDVVALERGEWHDAQVAHLEAGGEVAVLALDPLEHLLRPADEVHLVDGHDDVLDAEQGDDEAVAARLLLDAVAGVDQDDGQVAVRRARRHVARVLLVARTVGDDEFAPARREVAIGHVDRDALLALRLEAVHQERQIDLAAGRALALAVAAHRGELILVDQLGVVEEAADERALAVVDVAGGQEAEQLLALLLRQVGGDVGGGDGVGHQKYPSFFFCSIDPDSSWSMARPCRSEVVATSISSMMSGTVAADDSIAPVNG
jgi:hypothetical protein